MSELPRAALAFEPLDIVRIENDQGVDFAVVDEVGHDGIHGVVDTAGKARFAHWTEMTRVGHVWGIDTPHCKPYPPEESEAIMHSLRRVAWKETKETEE